MAVRQINGCEKIALSCTFSGGTTGFSIGKDSIIRDNGMIRYKYGTIAIGNSVLISHNVTLLAGKHNYLDANENVIDQGYVEEKLVIGDSVWIGANSTIMGGIMIGKGAIVGAMSLVDKDIPPYEVWGGVPARFIKKRGTL